MLLPPLPIVNRHGGIEGHVHYVFDWIRDVSRHCEHGKDESFVKPKLRGVRRRKLLQPTWLEMFHELDGTLYSIVNADVIGTDSREEPLRGNLRDEIRSMVRRLKYVLKFGQERLMIRIFCPLVPNKLSAGVEISLLNVRCLDNVNAAVVVDEPR